MIGKIAEIQNEVNGQAATRTRLREMPRAEAKDKHDDQIARWVVRATKIPKFQTQFPATGATVVTKDHPLWLGDIYRGRSDFSSRVRRLCRVGSRKTAPARRSDDGLERSVKTFLTFLKRLERNG